MTNYVLHTEPGMFTVSLGTPRMTVVRTQNPLVTEFKRAASSQLGRAVIQIPQALLLAALYWLIQRFTDH